MLRVSTLVFAVLLIGCAQTRQSGDQSQTNFPGPLLSQNGQSNVGLEVTFPPDQSTVGDGFTLFGTCTEVGQIIQLVGTTEQTVCNPQGMWAMTMVGWPLGAHQFVFVYADPAYDIAPVQIDLTRVEPPAHLAISSPSQDEQVPYQFTVSGTCSEVGEKINISGYNSQTGPTCQSDGRWAFTFVNLPIGTHTLTFSYRDNRYAGVSATVRFIRVAPQGTLTITSPSYDEEVPNQFTIHGTCSEAGEKINIVGYNSQTGPVCNSNGLWSFTFIGSPLGPNTFTFRYRDPTYSGISASVRVIRVAPQGTLTITSPSYNEEVPNQFTIHGTCSEAGEKINIDGYNSQTGPVCNSNGLWSYTLIGLPLGPHALTFRYRDSTYSGISASVRVVRVAPDATLTITSPSYNEEVPNQFTIRGTCSEAGEKINVVGYNSQTGPVCNSSGLWSYTFIGKPLGPHTFTFHYRDSTYTGISASVRVIRVN